jgi:tRNA threonylcarbamoyl adenosine modification protein (Sua5/YciO/YrdC/YwlC family)
MSPDHGPAAGGFERVIADGGVVLFPSDTVYGLACDPDSATAVSRLYALKGRAATKPSAVMFFDLDAALGALPDLGEWTRGALTRLMPGGVTVLLPNPAGRYPLACGDDLSTLGLRVISVPALAGCGAAVMQSSANTAGHPDPRRLADVPTSIRAAVDLVIDGGELPGTPSTVVDLRSYEAGRCGGGWSVTRSGAVTEDQLMAQLDGQFHFNPATYAEMISEDLPDYGLLQDEIVAASIAGPGPEPGADAGPVRRILDLGTGTGETAARLLVHHTHASLVGVDESEAMLGAARERLSGFDVELRVGRLQDPLPGGPFDLVASALCVHHLDGEEKADLFTRIRDVLASGGRFVLGDVVVPEDQADVTAALTPGYDKPSTVGEQLRWLASAGLVARVTWSARDLAVLVAEAPR